MNRAKFVVFGNIVEIESEKLELDPPFIERIKKSLVFNHRNNWESEIASILLRILMENANFSVEGRKGKITVKWESQLMMREQTKKIG